MNQKKKHCRVCGRVMRWRSKWRRNWERVRYCSKACRQSGLTATDRTAEAVLLALLDQHQGGRGIRPDAVAEKMATIVSLGQPHKNLSAARNAARRLYNRGMVDILQHGRHVEPSHARGPFRIRRRRAG